MTKLLHICSLLMFVFFASCEGQGKKDLPTNTIKTQTKDLSTPREIDTKYEYTDSNGKSLIIQNSFPRGDGYTDPNEKEYFKVIFWTRITNETGNHLELKINFPVEAYEVSSLPGKFFKILVLPHTLAVDKEPLYNYGLTDLDSFLDNNIDKPSSLNRTINPKESSGFYLVILFDKGVGGPIRTGLSITGQNLFYRISRLDSTPAHSLMNEKEIHCGSINLNLK